MTSKQLDKAFELGAQSPDRDEYTQEILAKAQESVGYNQMLNMGLSLFLDYEMHDAPGATAATTLRTIMNYAFVSGIKVGRHMGFVESMEGLHADSTISANLD